MNQITGAEFVNRKTGKNRVIDEAYFILANKKTEHLGNPSKWQDHKPQKLCKYKNLFAMSNYKLD